MDKTDRSNQPVGQEKKKYRLNKQKFCKFLFALLFMAGVTAAAILLMAGGAKATGAASISAKPDQTAKPDNSSNLDETANPDESAEPDESSKQDNPSTPARSGKTVSNKNVLEGKTIVVDAGHGGFDCGAIGVSGMHEDVLNLEVAKELEAVLKKSGVHVTMTRDSDKAIADSKKADMAKRRQIIESSGPDIVVSIHMNSHPDPSTSGPIAFFMQGSLQGEKLAGCIQAELNKNLKPKVENSAHADDFFILKSGLKPCVIVECGFITNAKEEAKLKDAAYRKKLARAIQSGVEDFFNEGS